jgi:hypothetical protein
LDTTVIFLGGPTQPLQAICNRTLEIAEDESLAVHQDDADTIPMWAR